MNKKFTKLIAALALLVFMTPSLVGWGQATVYTSNVTLPVSGTNVSSCKVKINNTDYDATKLGKSGSGASANVTIPAGTTKLYVHCAAWNGKTSTLTLSTTASGVSINPSGAWSLTSDSGISGSSTTFTLNAPSNASTVYFKEYTLSGVNSQISVKFEAGGERAVFWGVNTATGGGSSTESITISPSTISAEYTGITSTGYDSNALSITTENISNLSLNGFSVVYSDTENGTFTNETPSWMQAYVVQSSSFKVGYSIYENSTQIANECYFKVMYSETASNAVHVTQSAAPAPTYTVTLSGNSINADYQGNVTSSTITVSTNLTGDEIIYDIYYNNNGTYTSTNPYSDWFVAEVNANNEIECTIDDNLTGTERPAQFKVYALDDEYNEAYSEVITLTQAAQPQVATPTFSPASGAVASGTEVSISCATENATIYYTVNNVGPTEYTTPIILTEATTIEAYASATGYRDSEIVEAEYTIRGDAVFTDGVYSETMTTQVSFDNMEVVNVEGEDWTWQFNNASAYINGYSSNTNHANVDWLITPKMAVENGKLAISFDYWHNYQDNQLAVKWSTSNDVSGTWNDLAFEEGSRNTWYNDNTFVIETNQQYVYVAFVYTSTNSASGAYRVRNFTARQCHTLAISNLSAGINTYTFAGEESEMLFEGEGSALVGVGLNAMISVELLEGYELTELLVNGVDHKDDIEGGMYQFIMPNGNVTVTATATRLPFWTVNFTTNGIADGTLEVTQGQAIGTQPVANESYIPAGFEFVGWYADDYQDMNTAPNYITFPYTPTSDVTLKAVFAEITGTEVTENKTYILEPDDFNSGGYSANDGDKVINGVSLHIKDVYKNSSIQFKASSGSLYNNYALGNYITSIVINVKTNTLKVFQGTTSNPTQEVSGTGSNSAMTYTFGENMQYFKVTSTSSYAQANSITVNYVETTTSYTYSNYRTSLTEYTLTITGYNNGGGWNLIASPVTMTPSINDIITDTYTGDDNTQRTYDLYYFDQTSESEWKNYRQNSFNLVPGKGYLYANKTGGSYTLTGTPYNGDGIIPLDYSEANPSESMRGLNLIGNPYNANTTIESDREFYIMNSAGSQIIVADDDHKTIAPMQGIFVKAEEPGESVTFTPASQGSSLNNNSSLVLNLIQNRGDVIDRAIVRLGNGGTLPKIQLFENSTKLYISQYNEDYAVVKAEAQGEMPVNFKAKENGNYTLSINVEGMEMNYLHLIDNMTGMDVDLLQTPSYTFNATTRDYESRFRLVFAANNNNEDGPSTGSGTFAFYSNGNWIINNAGEATLQVIDLTGRILSSETVNGSVSKTINAVPGVYMLRLINGENVNVQKIVVR